MYEYYEGSGIVSVCIAKVWEETHLNSTGLRVRESSVKNFPLLILKYGMPGFRITII